jgi:hypothetical protein
MSAWPEYRGLLASKLGASEFEAVAYNALAGLTGHDRVDKRINP